MQIIDIPVVRRTTTQFGQVRAELLDMPSTARYILLHSLGHNATEPQLLATWKVRSMAPQLAFARQPWPATERGAAQVVAGRRGDAPVDHAQAEAYEWIHTSCY